MTITQYQELAARTINRELSPQEMTRHALYGLASETGEVLGMYQKLYQGHSLNNHELRKEIGDVAWMLAELCTANGWSLDEVCVENIQKLRERYPAGFDADRSVHRPEYQDPHEAEYSGLLSED